MVAISRTTRLCAIILAGFAVLLASCSTTTVRWGGQEDSSTGHFASNVDDRPYNPMTGGFDSTPPFGPRSNN